MTESNVHSKSSSTRPSSPSTSKTLFMTEEIKLETNQLNIECKDIKSEASSSFSTYDGHDGQYQFTFKNEFHTAASQNERIPVIPGNNEHEGAKSTCQIDSYQLSSNITVKINDGGIQLNQMRSNSSMYSIGEKVWTNSGSALFDKENHNYMKVMSADMKLTDADVDKAVCSNSATSVDNQWTGSEGNRIEHVVHNNFLNQTRDVKMEPGTHEGTQCANPETKLGNKTEMSVTSGSSISLIGARTTYVNTNDDTVGSNSLAMYIIPDTLSEDMMPHVTTLSASSCTQTEATDARVSTPLGILGPRSPAMLDANFDQTAESQDTPQTHSRTTFGEDSLSLSSVSSKESMHNVGHSERVPGRNKGHRCALCDMVCKYNRDLIVHMRYHTGEKPFKCTMCNYACIRKGMLKVHMRVHTGERPFKCTVCSQGFKHSNGLIYHMRLHTGERPYQCSHCDRSFKSPPELNKHAQTHSKKASKCPTCGKEFIAEYILKKHQKVHEGKPHICTICKKDFLDPSRLTKHMMAHSDKVSSICDTCGKTFKTTGRLRAHLKTHSGVKPHVCTICGKAFIQKCHLEGHMSLHSGEKPFKCTVCNKKFTRAFHLKLHMRDHTGDKPYKCTFCAKTFNYSSHMNVHMRLHTGERPYRCSVCDKGFIHKGFLNKHMETHDSGY